MKIKNLTNPGVEPADGDIIKITEVEGKPANYSKTMEYHAPVVAPELLILGLANLVLTDVSANVINAFAGQYPTNENQVYQLAGTVIAAGEPYVLPEYIRNGLDVICTKGQSETDHLYFHPEFDELGGFVMTFMLPSSGNWMITADRQNKGLAFVGVDFRFAFENFDIKCRQVIT